MKRTRSIFSMFVCALVLLFTLFISETFAASVEYFANGQVSKIVTDKGTITYYQNGNVESITTSEGTAKYNLNGNIDSIVGTPSISLEEAKAELTKLESTPTTQTQTVTQADSSMPNTGVETSYLFLIPALAAVIIFLVVKLRKMKNM